MRTFLTGDSHWGHANVIGFDTRPFDDVYHMREELIRRWNEAVSPTDIVYHLGDVFFLGAEPSLEIMARLNGTIHLVVGNHDSRMKARVRDRFASCEKELCLTLDDVEVYLSHFPHGSWVGKENGVLHLHGHSHGRSPYVRGRYDVGCMIYDYRPVTLNEVRNHEYSLNRAREAAARAEGALPEA